LPDEADAKSAGGHDYNGKGKDFLAAKTVTHDAKKQPTKGTHQKWYGKSSKGCNGLRAGRGIWKEHLAQSIGDEAIYAKIKPLHRIAQGRSGDRLFELYVIYDLDIMNS